MHCFFFSRESTGIYTFKRSRNIQESRVYRDMSLININVSVASLANLNARTLHKFQLRSNPSLYISPCIREGGRENTRVYTDLSPWNITFFTGILYRLDSPRSNFYALVQAEIFFFSLITEECSDREMYSCEDYQKNYFKQCGLLILYLTFSFKARRQLLEECQKKNHCRQFIENLQFS